MRDDDENLIDSVEDCRGQVREVLARLGSLLVEGLKHGFFDYSITCEIGNGGRRHLVIRAGKSHKFTIPEDDLPR